MRGPRIRTATACAVVLAAVFSAAAWSQDSPAERVINASPYVIAADETLAEFVRTTARSAIGEHCAGCHGADLTGRPGVPNLVDYEWLWGVTGMETNDVAPVMAIQQTILYGVRNRDCPEDQMAYGACADTRYSEMPGYGQLGFPDDLLSDLVEWVVAMSGGEADAAAVERAQASVSICSECHGADGYGYVPYGGPSLRDDIWLYGDDRDTIYDVIANGRLGVCPPWAETLDAATIKSLAVYIWNTSLGL